MGGQDHRRGVLMTFGGQPVGWYSRRQDIVAQSITEAEYIADCKGCVMGTTIPTRTQRQLRNTNPEDRQRGGIQPLTNRQISPTKQTYRRPISLPPPASPIREASHIYHPGERESSRHLDKAHPNEFDISMETAMAEFDWLSWDNLLTDNEPPMEILQSETLEAPDRMENWLDSWMLE